MALFILCLVWPDFHFIQSLFVRIHSKKYFVLLIVNLLFCCCKFTLLKKVFLWPIGTQTSILKNINENQFTFPRSRAQVPNCWLSGIYIIQFISGMNCNNCNQRIKKKREDFHISFERENVLLHLSIKLFNYHFNKLNGCSLNDVFHLEVIRFSVKKKYSIRIEVICETIKNISLVRD